MLGHSSIAITADTYTSLLPETDRAIAEAAACFVARARATKQATEAAEKANADEGSGAEAMTDSAEKSAAELAPVTPHLPEGRHTATPLGKPAEAWIMRP